MNIFKDTKSFPVSTHPVCIKFIGVERKIQLIKCKQLLYSNICESELTMFYENMMKIVVLNSQQNKPYTKTIMEDNKLNARFVFQNRFYDSSFELYLNDLLVGVKFGKLIIPLIFYIEDNLLFFEYYNNVEEIEENAYETTVRVGEGTKSKQLSSKNNKIFKYMLCCIKNLFPDYIRQMESFIIESL